MTRQVDPQAEAVVAALTPEQTAGREEFRHLCFTLERAQGENLIQNCRDKFQFAKSYLVYGRDLEQIVAELKQSAAHGEYAFFTERGVAREIMTPALAEVMLKDWKGAIASKKATVAEMFRKRYGEEIDEFISTPHNSSRLIMASSFDEADAIAGLAELTNNRITAAEFGQVRADIAQIKTLLDRLGAALVELVQRVEKLASG
jgi:hypothetical protein